MKKVEEEIWKPVVGYEGLYEVSSLGRVKSIGRVANCTKAGQRKAERIVPERVLKQVPDKKGYIIYKFFKNGNPKSFKGHRLVADSFLLNPDDLPQINHINGDKTDNKLSNLEWVTPSQNTIHARATGLIDLNGYNSKLTTEQVIEIRRIFANGGVAKTKLARDFGVDRGTIHKVIMRRSFTHIQDDLLQVA